MYQRCLLMKLMLKYQLLEQKEKGCSGASLDKVEVAILEQFLFAAG